MKSKRKVRAIQSIVLLVILVILLIPVWWALVLAFDRKVLLSIPSPPRLLPQEFSLFNFQYVFSAIPMLRFILNTIFVVAVNTVIAVFFAMSCGYAFAKGKFRFKRGLFLFVIATMMMPFESRLIPLYLQFKEINMTNTYWPLILGAFAYSFAAFLCMQNISGLPDDLRESAYIDGAGEWRIFLQIIIPLSKPIIASVAILRAIEQWNSYLWPLVIITKRDRQLVSVGLTMFSAQEGARFIGPTMAASLLGVVPMVIVYLFLQKHIIASIAFIGIKG